MTGAGSQRRQVEEAWDQVAERYSRYWSPRFEPYLDHALSAFEPAPAGPLVVAGCGPGDEVLMMARRFPGRAIVATDLSPAMVAIARQRVKEAGLARALVVEEDADRVSGRVREAGGIFSAFVLQLLPSPLAALADWSRVIQRNARMALLFWPRHSDRSPFGRISTLLREKAEDLRPDWEKPVEEALPILGLRLTAGTPVKFEMTHGSPEEVFRELREGGPLQLAERRLGREALEEIGTRWLRDHGLEKRGEVWVHWPCAKLWIVERLDRT